MKNGLLFFTITILVAIISLTALAALKWVEVFNYQPPEPEITIVSFPTATQVPPSNVPQIEIFTPTASPPATANLLPYDGVVEHLFFHPLISYPELAFDGDAKEKGLDEYMVTVKEYDKILQSLYDKNYILVNMNDVWSEYVAEDGVSAMRRETLMIPEGKKPLIVSYDDVNYYDYMIENGFTHKLIIGGDGEIWSYGLDPAGSEVVTKELDAITILNEFVRERPDFSLNGVKGCLCLTGYQGVLGYRTQEGVDEALRSREIKEAKRVIAKLKADGWYFASHSWGHINFERSPLEKVIADANRWRDQVEPLVGKTKLMVYPFGSRLDGADETQTGEAFKYYHALGFRVFASVGRESYSYIKSDISAVVCDRMHSDGGTLRAERERYMKFYDAAEVWDDARPELGMRGAKDW